MKRRKKKKSTKAKFFSSGLIKQALIDLTVGVILIVIDKLVK